MATSTSQAQNLTTERAPEPRPEQKLATALDTIRSDAQRRATTYGKESLVPEGGE